jgi:ribonuclease HI
VNHEEVIEALPLLAGTSSQKAELIALTRALTLGKRKRINNYTDSKCAFLVLHAHAALWKERPLLSG